MSARHRLLAALIGASLVTAGLIGVASARLVGSAVQERFEERVRSECAALGWWVSRLDPGELQEFAVSSGGRLGYRITLIDRAGTVLADSTQDPAGLIRMDNHASRPEIQEALLAGTGTSVRTSRTTGILYFYYAQRLGGERNPAVVVRIALPAAQLLRARRGYAWTIGAVSFLALSVLCVISYGTIRRLSKPIESLTAAADQVAAGRWGTDLVGSGDDDIGRLTGAIRRMRDALVAEVGELESERRVLATVVSGIREGLLLVDRDLRVKLANPSFRQIFEVSLDPSGRLLPEVVRDPVVIHQLETSLTSGDEVRERVVRTPQSGRSFEMRITALRHGADGRPRGALALFFDITRLEALESVRREFVANVSHELRTPLTSIRAAVETLLDGGVDEESDRQRFLRIVQRHSSYMADLIDDLTDLSRIETGAVLLEPTEVGLRDLVMEVVEQVRMRYPATSVAIDVEVPDEFTLTADRRRLEQVLVNLLDNAVKFNRPGGAVRVLARRGDRGDEVEVRDTGAGIPSESLERVFHRFYRVDAARSKDVPGTGLGLSIVKHLMRLHGGSVRVESEYGLGASFFLEFPRLSPAPAGDDLTES